jgi:hypothetical protein
MARDSVSWGNGSGCFELTQIAPTPPRGTPRLGAGKAVVVGDPDREAGPQHPGLLEVVPHVESERESGGLEEGEEQVLVVANALDASPGRPDRLIHGLGTEVRQLCGIEVGPQPLERGN